MIVLIEVSILCKKNVSAIKNLVKIFGLWLCLLLGSSLFCQALGIVARI